MQEWAGCQSVTIAPGESTEIAVSNLNPSSSYIFRLFAIAPGGEESGPGPEVAFDTEGEQCFIMVINLRTNRSWSTSRCLSVYV